MPASGLLVKELVLVAKLTKHVHHIHDQTYDIDEALSLSTVNIFTFIHMLLADTLLDRAYHYAAVLLDVAVAFVYH